MQEILRRKCLVIITYIEENESKIHCWDTVTETELIDMIIDKNSESSKDGNVAKLIRCYEFGSKLKSGDIKQNDL